MSQRDSGWNGAHEKWWMGGIVSLCLFEAVVLSVTSRALSAYKLLLGLCGGIPPEVVTCAATGSPSQNILFTSPVALGEMWMVKMGERRQGCHYFLRRKQELTQDREEFSRVHAA